MKYVGMYTKEDVYGIVPESQIKSGRVARLASDTGTPILEVLAMLKCNVGPSAAIALCYGTG